MKMQKCKLIKILLLPLVVVVIIGLSAWNSSALLFPGPTSPTFDVPTDGGFTVENVSKTANAVSSGLNNFMQDNVKNVKGAMSSYAGETTGFMPPKIEIKKKGKAVSGSKKIKKSTIADITKPSSVKKAFYKLFLAYPADEENIKSAYSEKFSEFYQDTLVETYVAAREMEKALLKLEAGFAELSPSLVEGSGGNGAEDGSDNNGVWKNAYTAYDTMNELLKITEELAAMNAQLEAVKVFKQSVTPAPYKKGKKSSALNARPVIQVASVTRRGQSTLAFAQIDFNRNQKAVAKTNFASENGAASITSFATSQREAVVAASRAKAIGMLSNTDTPAQSASKAVSAVVEDEEDYEYDPAVDSPVKFVTAEPPAIASPFEGNREKLEELNKLDPIYTTSNEAVEIHNLIQSLPTYREVFEKYQFYVKLHEQSLEMLKASDKCVLDYLGRYYDNPEQVWSGGPLGENVANYDLRSGISGWAVKTFEVAKAEKTSPVDANDIPDIEIDISVDSSDLSNIEKNKEAAQKYKNTKINNPSKEKEINAINRETSLLTWKIGAEAAKNLTQDQYSSAPKWGTPRNKFPIWNDQKNFYSQYIDGKYNNIKEYLSVMEFNHVALKIAQQLNDKLAESSEIKAYNTKELSRLASVLGTPKEEGSEEKEETNPQFATLDTERQSAIARAQKQRDALLKPLEAKRQELNLALDAASEALNNFNQRTNTLKSESLKADVFVDSTKKQLKKINEIEAYGKEPENVSTYTKKTVTKVEKAIAPASMESLYDSGEPQNDVPEVTAEEKKESIVDKLSRTKFKFFKKSALDNGVRFVSSEILAFGDFRSKIQEIKDRVKGAVETKKVQEVGGKVLEVKEYNQTIETEQEIVYEGDSVAQIAAKQQINNNRKTKVSKDTDTKRYQDLAAVQKAKIANLNEQIAALKPQIEAINLSYTEQVRRIEEAYSAGVEAVRQSVNETQLEKSANSLSTIYKSSVEKVAQIGDLIGTASVKKIIGQAEGLIMDTKNYAAQEVEKARGDLYRLGDELYLPSSGKVIVKRHVELMDDLQNIPLDKLVASSSSLGKLRAETAITSALSTLFQQALTQKACGDGRCQKADNQYFIGLLPKAEDFSAPKEAPAMYMPPLREIVHFDDVDFENIPKAGDGLVTRDNFLNYGEEVPLVWQMILKEKAFVERDVDLSAILEAGEGREMMFMRGGRYPCRLGGKVIDIDPYDGQYMVVSNEAKTSSRSESSNIGKNIKANELLKKLGILVQEKANKVNKTPEIADSKLPECKEIELVGNRGIAAKFYYTVRDIEADTEGPAAILPREPSGSSSELGTLLKPQNSSIRFADKPLEVFNRLAELARENENANSEYKTNLKDEIFKNAEFNVNQFGDFLVYVEMETTYRQTMEELKASLDESKKMLYDSLAKAGFTPTSDFDLAKEADYNLARNNLDRVKNKLVADGFSGMSGVQISGNEIVEERLKKIKGVFTALRKDKDELLVLSTVSPSDSELDEMIKSEEVNQKVAGEYKKKSDEEYKKQINSFKRPYCAAY